MRSRRGGEGERIFVVLDPPGLLLHDQLDLGPQRQREIRDLMAGGEIHEDGHVEVGNQIQHEVLELVLFRAIEREVPKYDTSDARKQARSS